MTKQQKLERKQGSQRKRFERENGSWNRVHAGKVPMRDRLPHGTLAGMPSAA